MAGIARFFRAFVGLSKVAGSVPPIQSHLFSEGDRVFLRTKKKDILSAPLQKNNSIGLPGTSLLHNNIIGQAPGTTVLAQNGTALRPLHPSLEQYVTLTPRKVTPIYAHDANLIVSLLDINVPTHGTWNPSSPPVEILEAGTGHGSLTLHLARAIHAANAPPPSLPPPPQRKLEKDGSLTNLPMGEQWEAYDKSRHAVIHTVDVSPSFSTHAEKIVRGFRRGMYAAHVRFNVSHVSDWIANELKRRRKTFSSTVNPFISYAVLDLPSAHKQLANVASVMRTDGHLVVFVPSVTQIGDCVKKINEENIPLALEKTLELGMGISNGRLWDVRLATLRARSTDRKALIKEQKASSSTQQQSGDEAEESSPSETESESESDDLSELPSSPAEPALDSKDDEPQVLVCRPKVGEKIVGGGFVALFRKI